MTPEELPGVMVFAFAMPHRIGSVCCYPCEQCGWEGEMLTTGPDAEDLPCVSFAIMAEATLDDWKRFTVRSRRSVCAPVPWPGDYYYFVTTD